MNISFKRINALLQKEFLDFYRNINTSVMLIFPIIIAVMYRRALKNSSFSSFVLPLCLDMNFLMVGCFVTAMIIAEEKEKNTLRSLMLSPVNVVEFILGKFIISGIVLMVINIIIFFILGIHVTYLVPFIIVTLLTTIVILFLGGLVGLLAKDQMQTGTLGLPYFGILLIIPVLGQTNKNFKIIAELIPTYHSGEAMNKLLNGQCLLAAKFNLLALIAWIFISLLLFIAVYNKNKLDE